MLCDDFQLVSVLKTMYWVCLWTAIWLLLFFLFFFFLGAILNFLAIHLHCYGVNGQIAPIHELTECLCPVFEISFTIVN